MTDSRNGAQHIDAAQAIAAAQRGLAGVGLNEHGPMAGAVRDAHPGRALLVVHLDDQQRAYYLITWERKGTVVLVVRIDAATGDLLGSAAWSEAGTDPFLTPEQAQELAAEKLHDRQARNPELVWKPCRQSTSPYRPLYRLAVSDGFVFVDMAGDLHSELTPLGRGG